MAVLESARLKFEAKMGSLLATTRLFCSTRDNKSMQRLHSIFPEKGREISRQTLLTTGRVLTPASSRRLRAMVRGVSGVMEFSSPIFLLSLRSTPFSCRVEVIWIGSITQEDCGLSHVTESISLQDIPEDIFSRECSVTVLSVTTICSQV